MREMCKNPFSFSRFWTTYYLRSFDTKHFWDAYGDEQVRRDIFLGVILNNEMLVKWLSVADLKKRPSNNL